MKKILIIGDSHLGRADVVLHKIQQRSFVIDLVPAPGPVATKLLIDKGCLTLSACDEKTFEEHPLSAQHDFFGWYKKLESRINLIAASGKIPLDNYAAVVVIGFQFMDSQTWAETRLAEKRGCFSSACATSYYLEKFRLNAAGNPSMHLKILDQIHGSTPRRYSVFSVPTPLINEEAEFSKQFSGTFSKDHRDLLSGIQNICGDFLLRNYNSTLIHYPDELVAADNISTKSCYRWNNKDFTHLNDEGARIWFLHILEQLRKSLPNNPMSQLNSRLIREKVAKFLYARHH